MKKKIILALILSVMGGYSELGLAQAVDMADTVKPEPETVVPVKEKTNFWKKLKFSKKSKQNQNASQEPITETTENTSIFSQNADTEQNNRVEIKSLAQIEDEQKQKSKKERREIRKAENSMTMKERQGALAEKVSNDNLSKEITESILIQGAVEENVLVSVDDCVKLALYNNPTIRYAMSNADIYKTKIAQAWSAYFPQFNLGTAYSKNDMLMTNFKFPNQRYTLWNAVAIEGSLLLFDFGKAKQGAKIATKTHEATLADVQTAINETVYGVKSAYYQYLYTLRQQQVLQSTVDKFKKHYLEAKAGYEVGARAKIDVITAEYNLSNAELDLIKAKNKVDIAKAQLNNVMGLPKYSNYNVTDNMELERYELDFDKLVESAYSLRPELQSVTKKAEASKVLVTSSKLAFTPDLKGFGSYTLGGKKYADDYGYQLGLRLSYPTTNFFLLKKQVDEAKATHERDLAELDKKKNDVYLDVKTAYVDYVNAKDSVPVAHKAMNEAKLQYEIAAGRYKTGLGDAIELKDAENTYRNAQLNYYNSLMLYNTAVAGVERMVGSQIRPISAEQAENTNEIKPIDVNL